MTQYDGSIDLLDSDASEELLELELRAATPAESRKQSTVGHLQQEGIIQVYEEQLAGVHDQVDALKTQLEEQARMGEGLQVGVLS